MSVAELDALRERQMAAKEKPVMTAPGDQKRAKPCHPCLKVFSQSCVSATPKTAWWHGMTRSRAALKSRNDELDDLVIARPDGTPTYNFCVVVDDIDMAITHVIVGTITSTTRLGRSTSSVRWAWNLPVYAHLPTVLNEQGEKMSKRNGAKPVTQYRDEGYLPRP